jgi:hypothetical protein
VSAVTLDLSGILLRLEGLPAELAARCRAEWAGFVGEHSSSPFLAVSVRFVDGPLPDGAFAPKKMLSTLKRGSARFSMPEGQAAVALDGRCEINLVRGLGAREYYSLANLLRASLAWLLPSRGGMLLHAAGLVVEQRAFLLVGPEGSGKSSWAALGERAGGRVLSDDLVLLDGAGRGIEALGSPFRSTHEADYRPGRWPLAAILFPRHGDLPGSRTVEPLLARARLLANLTFVAEALEQDPRIAALIDRLTDDIPCAELTYALDPSFMRILRGWPDR